MIYQPLSCVAGRSTPTTQACQQPDEKAQRDNGATPARLTLKKTLGPSVIHSMPGAQYGKTEGKGPLAQNRSTFLTIFIVTPTMVPQLSTSLKFEAVRGE